MDENNKFDVVGTNIAEKATMIWNVADMLRGPFKPHEYGLVILPMTVVKRFHDCLLPTISCSHPCLARYNKNGSKEYPINCGYCYPCLIRKSSLLDIDEIKKYSYKGEAYEFLMAYEESEKSADLRAVLGSIYRCKHSSDKELKRDIRCVGELTEEEVGKFLVLYKKSIDDLVQLFSGDQRMKEYLGL